jgi:hypothetical protein
MLIMNPKDDTAPAINPGSGRSRSAIGVLVKSLVATSVLVGAIAVSQHFFPEGTFWPAHPSGDEVSRSDAEARAVGFAALAPLPLMSVPPSDEAVAIDGMQLSPTEKTAFSSKLHAIETSARDAVPKANAQLPQLHRLAWVTLWDTDAEDGDAVRLDSEGYSRTVTLTKKPLTLAVPVPRDGVIKVTGIRDGEGGGITVGFASGPAKAVFPIMSVGQTLGLKVSIDR